ncbi:MULTISPECIES: hypothetical protein [Planktothricoides]|uniref:Uncharacterized protein n=2 Tax=Planktothricoides raciborskii TaxID=132608 RepID=A0AAU8JD53_9CYAN|nr:MULTISPECIES: hypothetical protein [Planktothricoides]MBD2545965.1 hypothetical protein [Planktothricoides raciborskii FACHB-1370]MBD2584082.1 hypothetical protein [Planktothricoides raciborskii FACHB-1261]
MKSQSGLSTESLSGNDPWIADALFYRLYRELWEINSEVERIYVALPKNQAPN